MDRSILYAAAAFVTPHSSRPSSQKLMTPKAFQGRITVIPKTVMLKDSVGRIWQVSTCAVDGDVYFVDGWESFIKENSIRVGEFIVFKYDGVRTFDLCIFERSGCEKKYVEPRGSKSCEDEDEEEDSDEGEREDNDTNGDVEDREEHSVIEIEDDDNDDEEEEEHKEKDKRTCCADRSKKGTSDRAKLVEPDLEVQKYVHYKIPYFVTKGPIRKRPHLFVPTTLIKKFKLNMYSGREINLIETESGRNWKEEVKIWRDGRVMITGWHKFCERNGVTKDDRCICEFTSVEGNAINVHIVRSKVATK